MTTDRELLELAAKAAGVKELFFSDTGEPCYWGYYDSAGKGWNPTTWNPLTDDGDALRLEVDLNLTQKHRFLEILYEENGRCDGDYRKASRLAIVRAATEIGRQMK